MIPISIKVKVAKIDRADNLGIPQTPWPEVHPLPSLVPKPTIKPAEITVK